MRTKLFLLFFGTQLIAGMLSLQLRLTLVLFYFGLWVAIAPLVLASIASPIYLRYHTLKVLSIGQMISSFILAISGVTLANVVLFFYWLVVYGPADSSQLWGKDFKASILEWIVYLALVSFFYWLSMLIFSRKIADSIREHR